MKKSQIKKVKIRNKSPFLALKLFFLSAHKEKHKYSK